MHHSKDGLYFDRKSDGSVTVSHWLRGTANAGRADQAPVDVLDRAWTLTPAEWASVVAAVSVRGESGDTHALALKLHQQKAPE